MEANSNKMMSYFILGLLIAVGLIGAGYFSGQAIAQLKASQKYLTVKGLSERNVKANLAAWEIDYREGDNDLSAANQRLQHDQQIVINYLHQKGFTDNEIELRAAKVNDLFSSTDSYSNSNNTKFRYIVTSGVRVRTTNVDLVQKVNQQTSELIQQGIPLSFSTSDYSSDLNPNPSYYYTQLDSIRPQMLSESTQSAYTIAQQFAKDSDTKIIGISQASQGVFQIASRDSASIDNGGQNEASSIYKKIRLVTTIQYILGQ